jgi:hypothetical protein
MGRGQRSRAKPRKLIDMSQQKEDRARQKFSDKMRQKSLAAKNARVAKKEPETVAPAADVEGNKKD